MSKPTAQQLRVSAVLDRMIALVESDEKYAPHFSESLTQLLDQTKASIGFGIEGQLDPRGNPNNGEFSMNFVATVDDDCPHGEFTSFDCEKRIQHGICGGCSRQKNT